jgi:arylsulfatase A-like enzyme
MAKRKRKGRSRKRRPKQPERPRSKAKTWAGLGAAGLAAAILVLVFWLAGTGGDTTATAGSTGDNLILISIDTLRADHLGVYGYSRNTSPRIDAVASEGAAFTQAQVQWPKTGPSIASIMTSTYCAVNGARALRIRLDDKLVTLAEVLRDAGFYTTAFIANVNVGRYFNFTQGFEEVHEMWDHSRGLRTQNTGTTFLSNDEIAGRVVQWLRSRHDRRFFLWVHFLDPHGPYVPPTSMAEPFVNDGVFAARPEIVPTEKIPNYQRSETHKSLADFIAAYDAEIVYSDAAVGTILDEVNALGLRERTLLVITADHGESLGEHDYYFNHGRYAYEVCTRVPLILRHPTWIKPGLRFDTPVALLDLVPTVLDFLDVTPELPVQQFQGRSLRPMLAGDTLTPAPIFIESRSGQRAVRSGRWKYIVDPRKSLPELPVVANRQLYDVQSDPLETRNLAAEHPEVVRECETLLARWSQLMQWTSKAFHSEHVPDEAIDQALLEQLHSLGYVGGPADAIANPLPFPGTQPEGRDAPDTARDDPPIR